MSSLMMLHTRPTARSRRDYNDARGRLSALQLQEACNLLEVQAKAGRRIAGGMQDLRLWLRAPGLPGTSREPRGPGGGSWRGSTQDALLTN